MQSKRTGKGLAIRSGGVTIAVQQKSALVTASSATNFAQRANFALEFAADILTFHNSKCIVVISIANESVSVKVNCVHLA